MQKLYTADSVISLLLDPLHGKLDTLLVKINTHNLDCYDIAYIYHFHRMLDVLVGHLGDVYKAILMDSYIYKCSEVDYISDGSLKHHALGEILHFKNITTEDRLVGLLPASQAR